MGPDLERLGGGELPLERLERGEGEVELVDVVLAEPACDNASSTCQGRAVGRADVLLRSNPCAAARRG